MTRQEEKAITIQVPMSDLVLDGIFIRGTGPEPGGAVLAPPHPLFGGSMASPPLGELAHACKKAGYATIRFDWRGVGASAGEPSGEAEAAGADYGAALAYLEETVPGPLLAAGYSFGAVAALHAAARHPRVRRLLLLAPPAEWIDRDALNAFRGRVLIIAGEHDEISPLAELRKIVGDEPRWRVESVAGANHFFVQGLADLDRIVSAWLGGD